MSTSQGLKTSGNIEVEWGNFHTTNRLPIKSGFGWAKEGYIWFNETCLHLYCVLGLGHWRKFREEEEK